MRGQYLVGLVACAMVVALLSVGTPTEVYADERADREAAWGYPFFAEDDPLQDKRREVPNYDGRDKPPPSAADVLLWIPRFLLLPAYFATDAVLRGGLGNAITFAEEEEIPTKLIEAFKFGPNNEFLIAPTFSFDFGLRPNVGLTMRFGQVFHKNNTITANAAFGGLPWVSGSVGDTFAPSHGKWSMGVKLSATRRRDGLFFGLDQEIDEDNEAKFNWVGYEAAANFSIHPWRRTALGLSTGYRYNRFGDDIGDDATSIPDLVADGRISALPPGFESGFSVWFGRGQFRFDTREKRPTPGSGLKLTGFTELGVDLGGRAGSDSWVLYGGWVQGYWDVSGHQHVISLGAGASFADPLKGEVPFTQLPAISGTGPLPGFVARYLIGESAVAARLQYTWPVWLWLDGKLHFAVGNVFDDHLKGFAFEELRMSFGVGLAAVSKEDHFFEILIALGTDTFEQGPSIAAVRLLFGASREF